MAEVSIAEMAPGDGGFYRQLSRTVEAEIVREQVYGVVDRVGKALTQLSGAEPRETPFHLKLAAKLGSEYQQFIDIDPILLPGRGYRKYRNFHIEVVEPPRSGPLSGDKQATSGMVYVTLDTDLSQKRDIDMRVAHFSRTRVFPWQSFARGFADVVIPVSSSQPVRVEDTNSEATYCPTHIMQRCAALGIAAAAQRVQ